MEDKYTIVAYKYNPVPEDCSVVLEDEHGSLFLGKGIDNYNNLQNLSAPLNALLAKWGFSKVQDKVEYVAPAKIVVSEEGVTTK